MPCLSEYTNVYNTAMLLAESKGYRLWYDEKLELFCAEKDGWDFMGESPVSLLGLIMIYEHKNPEKYEEYWWKEEGPDIYRSISHSKPSYKSVLDK